MGLISAVHKLTSRGKFSTEPGIEPGAAGLEAAIEEIEPRVAGWKARTLPLRYAVPPAVNFLASRRKPTFYETNIFFIKKVNIVGVTRTGSRNNFWWKKKQKSGQNKIRK